MRLFTKLFLFCFSIVVIFFSPVVGANISSPHVRLTYADKMFFKFLIAYYKVKPSEKKVLDKSLLKLAKNFYEESKIVYQYLRLSEEEKLNFIHPQGKILNLSTNQPNYHELFNQAREQIFRNPTPSYSIYSEIYLEAFHPTPLKFSDAIIINSPELRALIYGQADLNQREFKNFFKDIHWQITGNAFYPNKVFDRDGWVKEWAVLKRLSDEDIEKFGVQLATDFKSYLNNFVNDSSLSIMNPAVAKFIDKTFSFYFENLSIDSKKLILSDWVSQDFTHEPEKVIEIMVQNSGPHFQKLVQALVKEGALPTRLKRIFKKIESTVKPIPDVFSNHIISPEAVNYNLTYVNKKALATGSMAQVHVAKYHNFYDVVVRFLKPGIQKRAQEDYRILKLLASQIDKDPEFSKLGIPKISVLVDDIHYSVSEELNINKTFLNQRKARKVYHGKVFEQKHKVKISVPWIMTYKEGSKILIQEKVDGVGLESAYEKYKYEIPDLKRLVVESIATTWIDEVLFGSGFYHSDPHEGNFLVAIQQKKTFYSSIYEKDPVDVESSTYIPNTSAKSAKKWNINVNLLDYGMSGQLTKLQQDSVIKLGIGVELMKTDLIVNSIWNLIRRDSQNEVQSEFQNKSSWTNFKINHFLRLKNEYRKLAAQLINEAKMQNKEVFVDDFIVLGLQMGIRFENNFLNLNRGRLLLDKMLLDSGSKYTVKELGVLRAYKHKYDISKLLLAESEITTSDIFEIVKGFKTTNTEVSNVLKKPIEILKASSAGQTALKNSFVCSGVYK